MQNTQSVRVIQSSSQYSVGRDIDCSTDVHRQAVAPLFGVNLQLVQRRGHAVVPRQGGAKKELPREAGGACRDANSRLAHSDHSLRTEGGKEGRKEGRKVGR